MPPSATHDGGQNSKVCGGRDACSAINCSNSRSRKIILSLSERLSKVSESVLLAAFFLCLDYFRSNIPACVAVNKQKLMVFITLFAYSNTARQHTITNYPTLTKKDWAVSLNIETTPLTRTSSNIETTHLTRTSSNIETIPLTQSYIVNEHCNPRNKRVCKEKKQSMARTGH